MSEPWNFTEAQRRQFREAQAEAKTRELLTGNPAMARKPGRDVVDLALYEDDPEYRAMIDAKYPAEPEPGED